MWEKFGVKESWSPCSLGSWSLKIDPGVFTISVYKLQKKKKINKFDLHFAHLWKTIWILWKLNFVFKS